MMLQGGTAMTPHVCEHLRPVEDYLVSKNIPITFAGKAWSRNCRLWVYFDACLDGEALIRRFGLGPEVTIHVNDDPRSGREQGLDCGVCHDAVMGRHPLDRGGKGVIS
jgi:hypothetical protein